MNLTEITTCMKAYNDIIGSGTDLVELYKQGSYFEYTRQNLSGSSHVHAYPGIDPDGKLVFFVIPSAHDVPGTHNPAAHTQVCDIQQLLLGSHQHLPNHKAKKMCEDWLENFESWIPDEVAMSTFGMFQCFAIPSEDFSESVTLVNLALKTDEDVATGYRGDVVVTNITSTAVYFDDFAKTVPPYPATLTNSYYLLTLV
jgi:hypothetical protein